MNSQPPQNWMGMLLLAALLRMGYELTHAIPASNKDTAMLPSTGVDPPAAEWPSLLLWQRKASEKAVENYAAAQERKWRRWNEAMFEPNNRKKFQHEGLVER
jgi:hypothetical protein